MSESSYSTTNKSGLKIWMLLRTIGWLRIDPSWVNFYVGDYEDSELSEWVASRFRVIYKEKWFVLGGPEG